MVWLLVLEVISDKAEYCEDKGSWDDGSEGISTVISWELARYKVLRKKWMCLEVANDKRDVKGDILMENNKDPNQSQNAIKRV